jgi:hypothetical protein
MNMAPLKTLSLFILILLSNYCYTQNTSSANINDSLRARNKRHAIVLEGLGKSWGVSLSYEYKFHANFSGGIGYGTSPVFFGGKHIGVGYGVFRMGKKRNHFVTSAGVMFSNKILSPNLGLGYEFESDHIYFRAMPYAILGMDNDYPILPSLGLYFGIKI